MTHIPRTPRWLSGPARTVGRAGHRWQPLPSPLDPWAGDSEGADMPPVDGWPSFRRIVPIPFGTWMAALERWQLTGPGGELRLGHSVLCGPAEHDPHFGTCRVEAYLARGLLRPPTRMRLGIDHWSATATILELIPCRRVQPTAAYSRAGRDLLEALAQTLPEPAVAQTQPGRRVQHIRRHRQSAATPVPMSRPSLTSPPPPRVRAGTQGLQLRPDLAGAGVLDLRCRKLGL